MIVGLGHVDLVCRDLDRSLGFYRDLLGFRFEHELAVEGEPSDTLLRLRDVKLHATYLVRDGVRIELERHPDLGRRTEIADVELAGDDADDGVGVA